MNIEQPAVVSTTLPEYHKIAGPFRRHPESHKVIFGDWTAPELEMLCCVPSWYFTEKLDGMNIRVVWDGTSVSFRGRTDNANLTGRGILDALGGAFAASVASGQLADLFSTAEATPEQPVILFGELVGPKIQAGGHLYGDTPRFFLFDARVGHRWLKRESIETTAAALGLQVVPVVGRGTLLDGIEQAQQGFGSKVSLHPKVAEGTVARLEHELFTRAGARIIVKLKTDDLKETHPL